MDTDTYRVIGDRAVGGVQPGGTVRLDPARVNIPALLGVHVERVDKAPAREAPAAKPPRSRRAPEPRETADGD